MFAFLTDIPGADGVRALANRVDTARHHGIPDGCVLELELRGLPPETAAFDPLALVSGGGQPMALREAIAALHRAADDPRVAGLIARVQLAAAPMGAVQELREAIAAFSAVKPSLVWAETYPGTLSYYLASAFGEVWMQPSGGVGMIGFASNATFLRDALDKAGVEAQVIARGEYKSAANVFTEDGFTDAHREAVTRMLASIKEQVWGAVAASRDVDVDGLDALADRAPLLRDDALAAGLIDRIGFRDEAYARIAELVGAEDVSDDGDDSAPPRLRLSRYAGAARPWLAAPPLPGRGKPTIAVVTVEGPIVNGRGGPQLLPFGNSGAGGDTIAAALREVAADESVSAIVLRVDSPGGSVTASETIWHEVIRARERGKPVVASMGAVAASGGYYVAAGADAIVANPGTITGSIGVLIGKLVLRDLKERLGVASDSVRTNANADAWSMDEPFTEEQQLHRENEADLHYADFVERVAQGRNLTAEAVDVVARGRVWTGADAQERGLVDELGGFRAAVRRAKVLAGLDEDADVRLVDHPGGSLLGLLHPRALLGRSAAGVGEILNQVERSLVEARVLWQGPSRF